VNVPGAPIVNTNSADDKVTYRGVLQWTLGDQMLYGSVSTGFKSGGYSPTTPTNPQIHPEEITAYEVGIKGMVADRMVNYSLAGFWYDYSNLQISTVSDGRPVTVNAAAARIRGIEWSVAAKLTPTFSISTNGQYLDTEYTDYRNVQSYVAIPGSMFSALGPLIDATGNHLRIAPEWTIGASVDKTFPLANDSEINVNLTYQYNDGYYFYSDERVRQPSFHLVNARVGWTSPNKQYQFGVFGRNLAGEKYYVAARVSQTNGDFGTFGEPRRYGVYAEAKFYGREIERWRTMQRFPIGGSAMSR
jgi:iron complex outermembrane receptor protein